MVCGQVYLAVTEFKLSYEQLRKIILNGFRASFMDEGNATLRLATQLGQHGSNTTRSEYLERVSQYFDAVAMKHRKRTIKAKA